VEYHAGVDINDREELGIWAHQVWLTVKKQQRKAGLPVNKPDLALWEELTESAREVFRKSGESLLANKKAKENYEAMWLAEMPRVRKEMGEKAFRAKLFEVCVAQAVSRIAPQMTEAEQYRATDVIVKMAGMLEVPAEGSVASPPQSK